MSYAFPSSRLLFLGILSVIAAVPASGQVNGAALASLLTGRTVASKIDIGYMGRENGSAGTSALGTVIYPDSAGGIRVEMKVRVGMSVFDNLNASEYTRFTPGSEFHVGKVEIKNDYLEFLLTSSVEPEKQSVVRILFNRGWQSNLTNDAVLGVIEQCFRSVDPPSFRASASQPVDATQEAMGQSADSSDSLQSIEGMPPTKALHEENRLQGLISFEDEHQHPEQIPLFLNSRVFLPPQRVKTRRQRRHLTGRSRLLVKQMTESNWHELTMDWELLFKGWAIYRRLSISGYRQ